MTIKFKIDQTRKLYQCHYTGSVDDAEHYDAWTSFIESRQWPVGYLEFVDMTGLTSATLTPSGIQKLADYRNALHRFHGINQKYLVLAPSALGYGLSRMFHTYSDTPHSDITFVKTPLEAEQYITAYLKSNNIADNGSAINH